MKTIEERWARFRREVMDPDAPEVQVHEMHLAFYAGFTAMLDTTWTLDEMPAREAIEILEKFSAEARLFSESLMNG